MSAFFWISEEGRASCPVFCVSGSVSVLRCEVFGVQQVSCDGRDLWRLYRGERGRLVRWTSSRYLERSDVSEKRSRQADGKQAKNNLAMQTGAGIGTTKAPRFVSL